MVQFSCDGCCLIQEFKNSRIQNSRIQNWKQLRNDVFIIHISEEEVN